MSSSHMSYYAVVLAAGKGTRMRSKRPKVVHELLGRPLIRYPLEALKAAGIDRVCVVVGHRAQDVQRCLSGLSCDIAIQEEQIGTANAVLCALPFLEDHQGPVLIMCGDMPLLRSSTISSLIECHRRQGNDITVLSAIVPNPEGYGRILRKDGPDTTDGPVLGIVEEKDATRSERSIREINTGTYVMEIRVLKAFLDSIGNKNAQREFYLTDIVGVACSHGEKVGAMVTPDLSEAIGVNSRRDLALAEEHLLKRLIWHYMEKGVTFIMPNTIYLEPGVSIERDVVVAPFCMLKGNTVVHEGAYIGPYSYLEDAVVGPGERITPYTAISGKGQENN